MNLRWKIALSLATVGVVVSVALGALTYRATNQRLLDEIDRSITQSGELLLVAADRFPQRRETFDVYSIRRFGPDGDVVASTFESPVPAGDGLEAVAGQRGFEFRETVTADDGERFRLHTIGLGPGSLQIARSLDETDAVLDDLRRRTVLLVAAAALGLALVGWVIAGRVAAPLRRLADSADEVRSTGRLEVSLPAVSDRPGDEVGQLTNAFSSMLDALRRSRSEQERLVQDAGHELRTPLTSLRTNLAVLRRHGDMSSDMRSQILADLDGEVSELTDLVNELVTVASGELASQPAELLDLAKVSEGVADRIARRRARRIDVVGAPGVFVLAPRAAIERAVSNVIDNSCKFDTGDAPIEVTIEMSHPSSASAAEPARMVARFRVLDRGPGIPPDELDEVFERFHRTETARATPGSGLGLAIVRDVVTAHGGAVVADNRSGGGAVIGFDLPLAAVES